MARVVGRNGNVKVGASTIANITDWSFDYSRPDVDQTCMGDSNAVAAKGLANVSGTISGILDDGTAGGSALWASVIAGSAVTLELHIKSDGTEGFTGSAVLNFSAAMTVQGNGTFSVPYTGAGSWAAL